METNLIFANLLNPPVLFFFAGLLAVRLGSDLDIPSPLPKFFSLYLLLSIGFKGGVELFLSGFSGDVASTLAAAVAISLLTPIFCYFILRRSLSQANAAATAATYGSVSAVTFITATALLGRLEIPFSGYMVAALALMESPAIIMAVVLYRRDSHQAGENSGWQSLLREAFLNGSVYLLVVSMLIGFLTGEQGGKILKPFTTDLFQGMLCLFLLDMGLVSSRRLGELKKLGATPLVFATAVPLLNATIGIFLARALGLEVGNALLFCILCASASYIAVPAAMRLAIPDANPGVYVTMALGITFPINVLIGLPLYLSVIQFLWR
jgi:hypothetical protein